MTETANVPAALGSGIASRRAHEAHPTTEELAESGTQNCTAVYGEDPNEGRDGAPPGD